MQEKLDVISLADRLRPDVLLTALSSRFIDLQGSRGMDEALQIAPPTLSPQAGKRGWIAAGILQLLEARIESGNTGFVSIHVIQDDLSQEIEDIGIDEVRFVARFLDIDREVGYENIVDGVLQRGSTRGFTRLIRYQARSDRVKLTDAGKLWLRIVRLRDQWLFEDKEIEKLTEAIHAGFFEQIPQLASRNVTSLRLLNEEITHVIESPSFKDLVQRYFRNKDYFGGMIDRSHSAAFAAMDLLQTEAVKTKYEEWLAIQSGAGIMLSQLAEHLARVHRTTESLQRNWRALHERILEDKRPVIGIIRFDIALDDYFQNPPSLEVDKAFLDGIGGWGDPVETFSWGDISGAIPPALEKEKPTSVRFNIAESRDGARFMNWLERNETQLREILSDFIPHSLFELLGEDGLDFHEFSDVSSLFGIYMMSEPLGGKVKVRVGVEHRLIEGRQLGYAFLASNVTVQMVKEEEQ